MLLAVGDMGTTITAFLALIETPVGLSEFQDKILGYISYTVNLNVTDSNWRPDLLVFRIYFDHS